METSQGPGLVLHEVFEAQAARRPDAVAVVFGSQAVTYGELNARANKLARHLRLLGVRRGATVGMLLPRSMEAYVAILGILKAGGAYVPIDPSYPADRVAWMLENSGAWALITDSALHSGEAFRGSLIDVVADRQRIACHSADAQPGDTESAVSDDLCYVIYTSGSTGRPKGVMVAHRSVCHLVQAESRIFGVHQGDRVYQGASLAFDLSVEELWLAFAAGATVIAGTPPMSCSGPDLSRYLMECGVTVLSCVPTLLTMLDAEASELPSLRLLILGGETCPQKLAERWARPWRRLVNTYGPTETTVIATYADVSQGRKVTIGRPVPGYRVYLLDDTLRPVPAGATGEICIAGTGVARGYLGLARETQERFVADLFAGGPMYRSGDLGRLDGEGNIEFAGRADGQVKLRGLRIELGEIEAAMLQDAGVQAAACIVCENAFGDSQLVGYVVPRVVPGNDEPFHGERLRLQLRNWLPAWMVPSWIETVDDLPRLPSGKLDRGLLAILHESRTRKRTPQQPGRARALPANSIEGRLLEVWTGLFDSCEITAEDDFFLNLGGHSLLAARMVSELRKPGNDPGFASVTLRDVYSHPTIERLASLIASRPDPQPSAPASRAPREIPARRHVLAGVAQAASLYFVFGVRGLEALAPWLVYFLLLRHHSAQVSVLWALASAAAVLPVVILIAVCSKWVLLGRVRTGRYPLWGGYYLRWWFVQTLVRSAPLRRLGGTPLLPFVYRMLGARVGKEVHIASDMLAAFDVISIGDGSSIDEGASLYGYSVEAGDLVIGPVSVGRECVVGTRSVVCPGAVMENGARLEDLSLLPDNSRIPAGETWSGSPAQRLSRPAKTEPEKPPAGRGRIHVVAVVLTYAALIMAFPLIELLAFLPGVLMLTQFDPAHLPFYLAAPVAGASFILCVSAEVVVLKWLLIGRARAGKYPVHGWFYVRNWIVEQLLAFSLEVAGPLHATIFLKPWYRALGAKLGQFAELSTASTTTPDLLDIGEGCTIADEVSLGAARVERGWLILAATKLGRRVFVGNGAVVPAGTTLGAESLVGVLTIAPAEAQQAARTGACWLGSPPIFLARRQTADGFPEQTTFRPPRRLQWARGSWELLRVTLPGAGFVTGTVVALDLALNLWVGLGALATVLLLPAVFGACCAGVSLSVIPMKWLVVGRYRPFERPLWSAFIWRLELVNALFEFLAVPIGVETLRGTPLLSWYLRLLGCRIGQRAYIDSTGFLEFDLVDVGDRAMLNADCILQTHLFEDRVLKASAVRVGADCEIGTHSIILYDSEMRPGAHLGALSLLMKGETLPSGRLWMGSPLHNTASDAEPAVRAPNGEHEFAAAASGK